MIIKTNEVQIFTFTGKPKNLDEAIFIRMSSHGNRVIDILSATESMSTVQPTNLRGFGVGFPTAVLHYTMLYRLT